MPISVPSFFKPAGVSVPFVLEDIYLRGGYRCVATLADRDALTSYVKKTGMMVYVIATTELWQLSATATWVKVEFGGKATTYTAKTPLVLNFDNSIEIDSKSILPSYESSEIDSVLCLDASKKPIWKKLTPGPNNTITRISTEYKCPPVANGIPHDFFLPLGKTIITLELKVDAFPVLVQAYSRANYTDANPYRFLSSSTILADEGFSEDASGKRDYKRRYAILTNLDAVASVNIYWRISNLGTDPIAPKMQLTYIVVE